MLSDTQWFVAGAVARRGETEVYFHTNSKVSAVDQGCQLRTSCRHTYSNAVSFFGTRQFLACGLAHRGGSVLSVVARLAYSSISPNSLEVRHSTASHRGDSVQFFFFGGRCPSPTTNGLSPAFLCGKTCQHVHSKCPSLSSLIKCSIRSYQST